MTSHLEALARRLEDDPAFLACLLKLYAGSERVTQGQLAQSLGCTDETLVLIGLCRSPGASAGETRRAVQEIATRFKVDPDVLTQVIRRGQALVQMRRPGSQQGLLAAARDAEQKINPPRPKEEKP